MEGSVPEKKLLDPPSPQKCAKLTLYILDYCVCTHIFHCTSVSKVSDRIQAVGIIFFGEGRGNYLFISYC